MADPNYDPNKLFYTIGEVATILNVKPYVLRYWETEFNLLNPPKTPTGQRSYRKVDLQTAILIKKLLYEDKFTIAGAKKKLLELSLGNKEQIELFLPPINKPTKKPNASQIQAINEIKVLVNLVKELIKKYTSDYFEN
jgi:DNA-binding transcriptional MerR regulator